MKTYLSVVIMVVSLMLYSCGGTGKKRPEGQRQSESDYKRDEKKVMQKILWLEKTPYSPSWNKEFRYCLNWAIGVPYIKVVIDTSYTKEFYKETTDRKEDEISQISVMYMMGNLLYLLENPGSDSTGNKAVRRGLVSMIRVYESIRKKNKGFRLKSMDKYKKLLKKKRLLRYIGKIKKGR